MNDAKIFVMLNEEPAFYTAPNLTAEEINLLKSCNEKTGDGSDDDCDGLRFVNNLLKTVKSCDLVTFCNFETNNIFQYKLFF